MTQTEARNRDATQAGIHQGLRWVLTGKTSFGGYGEHPPEFIAGYQLVLFFNRDLMIFASRRDL